MMIALTCEESEKVQILIQELIKVEEKRSQQCGNCNPSFGCDSCNTYNEYCTKKEVIDKDPLMKQPIIREYVYSMLRRHKLKKEIDELQAKINETYNIEKNYQKSIVIGDFYNEE